MLGVRGAGVRLNTSQLALVVAVGALIGWGVGAMGGEPALEPEAARSQAAQEDGSVETTIDDVGEVAVEGITVDRPQEEMTEPDDGEGRDRNADRGSEGRDRGGGGSEEPDVGSSDDSTEATQGTDEDGQTTGNAAGSSAGSGTAGG
jgi:hypothetical protein